MIARLALLSVAALALARAAHGGGFSTPIIGGRMVGRLAFAASADDLSAMYHNPAGLTQRKGYHVEASAVTIWSHTLYRIEKDDGTLSAPISSEHPYGILPFVGFAGDFGTERFRFGIALYSPHDTGASLPEDSPARFQLIKGSIVTLFLNPTVACQVTDELSVGVGVSVVDARAALNRWQDFGPSFGIPVTALVDVDTHDTGFNYDLGLLYKPTERLRLGLSYHSTTHLHFQGDLTARNPAIALTAKAHVTAPFSLPRDLRVGVDVQLSRRLDVGADLYWQDYSVYDALKLELSHVDARIGTTPITVGDGIFVERKDAHDTYGGALGATYVLSDRWQVRAGYLYDPSPYPDRTYTILSPDADKHGFGVGMGYARGHFTLDASFLRLVYKDRIVHDSILEPPANAEVRGKFNNAYALQMGWSF